MTLDIDPQAIATVATTLADGAREHQQALPGGWVLPAGADPITGSAIPQFNAQLADLSNRLSVHRTGTQVTAWNIGSALASLTALDDTGARAFSGSGGAVLANPVAPVEQPILRQPPDFALPTSGSLDPLVFAQQLHAGPGPGPASEFAATLRDFLTGPHRNAIAGLDSAIQNIQQWTPTGSLAAEELGEQKSVLDSLGDELADLADGIDSYSAAFANVKAKHPTPQEIIANRQEQLTAIESRNELEIQAALAKRQELLARSEAEIGKYTAAVTGQTSSSSQPANPATTSTTPPATATGGSQSSQNAGNTGDLSAMEQMLPLLMSSMNSMGANGLGTAAQNQDPSLDDPGGYYPDPSGNAPFNGGEIGGPDPSQFQSTDSTPTVEAAPLPAIAAAGAGGPAMPSAAVAEPFSASPAITPASRPASGSPYMPYMPMTPASGAAGSGSERGRVVAWHPDRLMYVDDTPHTEAVIGEKPTIAPLLTSATPVPNQAPTPPQGPA